MPFASRPRNSTHTRARILTAARQEFVRHGFAGARVEAIARRANVTPSLLFYYFQSKAALHRAVAHQRIASDALPRPVVSEVGDHVGEWPRWLFQLGRETEDAVRFALTEEVDPDGSPHVLEEERRRRSLQEQVARVAAAQSTGDLPAELDPTHLTFLLYVLGVYPYILPQSAYLIVGAGPHDPAFRHGFEHFLEVFGALLREPA